MGEPRKRPRKRRSDAAPLEVMAAAIAEADLEPDRDVAKRFGVGATVIKLWRFRAQKDPKLGELVAEERSRVLDEWRLEVGRTAVAAAKRIRRKLDQGDEIAFEEIAVMKTCGQLLTESSALLDPPKGRPAPNAPDEGG